MSFSKSEGSRYTNTKSNHFPCWANYLWLGLLLDRFQCSEIRCVLKSCQAIGNKPALSLTQQFSYYQKTCPRRGFILSLSFGSCVAVCHLNRFRWTIQQFHSTSSKWWCPSSLCQKLPEDKFHPSPAPLFFGKPVAFRWTTSKSSAAELVASCRLSRAGTDWGTQGGHRVQTNGSFDHQKIINMELRGELI